MPTLNMFAIPAQDHGTPILDRETTQTYHGTTPTIQTKHIHITVTAVDPDAKDAS